MGFNFQIKKNLILLTFLKYGNITGRKRFQKLIYLAKHKNKYKKSVDIPFIFTKYLYGPYSKEVQSSLDYLVLNGFITEEKVLYEDYITYRYSITDKGHLLLKLEPLPQCEDEKIKNLMKEYHGVETKDIVKEVYNLAGIN